ncbi:MAG TPA: fasciclin domain-containing protein, partial [Phnomibacter sp.]|nr:fasciclin domain-containing protein [Phnomibacter sp.]
MKTIKLSLLAITAASFTLFGCKKDKAPAMETVTDVVLNNPDFTLLARAVSKAGLADALSNTQNITVFAPNNAAFFSAGLTEAAIDAMDVTTLTNVLTYHVVPSLVRSTDIASGSSSAPTLLSNNDVYISNNATGIFINGNSRVVGPDVMASNGVIHVIDNIIMPATNNIVEAALATPSLSLLAQAVVKCNLQDALQGAGPFTVFAPTNAAFEAAGFDAAAIAAASGTTLETLRNVLLLHVLNGRVFSTDI